MKQYLDLVKKIMAEGSFKDDRTNTGTMSIFGYQTRFDLSKGFPLVTVKKTFMKGVIYELLWFIKGSTNIKYLTDNDVHIWDNWTDEEGELGPVYGKQWRSWAALDGRTIDQLSDVINQIKINSKSRRLIVSAWNVGEIDQMALPPCHTMFQFYVKDGKLSCQLYQRSADVFLGVPFNIASYSLLTMMIAKTCNLEYGDFVYTLGDAHIYSNHIDQVNEMLIRKPYELPTVSLNPFIDSVFDYDYYDIEVVNYKCHPAIKAIVAV